MKLVSEIHYFEFVHLFAHTEYKSLHGLAGCEVAVRLGAETSDRTCALEYHTVGSL